MCVVAGRRAVARSTLIQISRVNALYGGGGIAETLPSAVVWDNVYSHYPKHNVAAFLIKKTREI